jgi:hypothetical protein
MTRPESDHSTSQMPTSGKRGLGSFKVEAVIMSSCDQTEIAKKEANLIAAIETMLPDFARACRAVTPRL